MMKICLTVRVTAQAGTKVGHNDPAVMYGNTVAYRKKERAPLQCSLVRLPLLLPDRPTATTAVAAAWLAQQSTRGKTATGYRHFPPEARRIRTFDGNSTGRDGH